MKQQAGVLIQLGDSSPSFSCARSAFGARVIPPVGFSATGQKRLAFEANLHGLRFYQKDAIPHPSSENKGRLTLCWSTGHLEFWNGSTNQMTAVRVENACFDHLGSVESVGNLSTSITYSPSSPTAS
jgi:hypothetical protein